MTQPSLVGGPEVVANRFSGFAKSQFEAVANLKSRKEARMSQQVQEKYEESQLYKIRHSAAHIMAQAVRGDVP